MGLEILADGAWAVMNQSYEAVLGDVVAFLNEQTKGRFSISEQTDMARDLSLDSLAVMDVLLALEDKFDISIPINHLAEVQTVGDLARTIIAIKNG